ncbi:16S rRNA (guanine(527)-N(7))-methyltransferase RsmG [Falsiroseomonas bella]|uniref:Ribosomal RNA small subunit methyltransferase G n=1 Tax=Falsiroseomonas bella TaxID=2184016 RepID=A0A317FIX3_9PROT|nr:16S rRNA (guanine(527)-N(7))-methyltransferase RsmG [Falsiroseomonas bella]PWS38563.1 16S rRNA (guanine(527)-N(7))-methyltransferase RsmG [Falsiroseomonas bella]
MSVSRGTLGDEGGQANPLEDRLRQFLELLLRWNSRINLVADRDPAAIRRRHIEDSLQLRPLLPQGHGPIGDLGSGGGFPGLVLAMAESRPFHLIESDRRKAAFLTEAAAQLGLHHVRVHPDRIEAARPPPLVAITARALAPLDALLGHAERLLEPGGIALFPKGRTAEAELTDAGRRWTFQTDRFPSRTDPEATILRLSQIRRAGPDI